MHDIVQPNPKVSICMLTYNHEDYLRQSLDSVLMQEVDFAYEILVNDDASTDSTAQILQEYKERYPNIIRLVLHQENHHKKGMQYPYIKFLFPIAKGQYLAMNDGDDYWTDSKKLQMQIDYLDAHPECSMCFHTAKIVFDNNEMAPYVMPMEYQPEFTLYDLLQKNFMRVNSIVYRNIPGMFKANLHDCYGVDWLMNIEVARAGKIGYIDRVMSVWRRHENAVSWQSHKDIPNLLKQQWLTILNRYFEEFLLFDDDPGALDIVQNKIFVHINALDGVDTSWLQKLSWMWRLFRRYPILLLKIERRRCMRNA